MRDLNDLRLFAAVVAHNGFSAAGRALNVPKSRISRRVAQMEDELGVRLIERSTRRLSLTEVGRQVYGHAQAAVAEAEAIAEAVSLIRVEPRGLVRISCPMGLQRTIAEGLPAFLESHPLLRVHLLITNRRVDLIEEGVDIAIRVRERLDTDADLQLRRIGVSGRILVMSPALLEKRHAPATPADLTAFPIIGTQDRAALGEWPLIGPDGGLAKVSFEPRLSAADYGLLLDAAIAGVGIALLPELECVAALADGRLVRALPGWSTPEGILHLVFTSRRGMLPSVRIAIEFAVAALQGATHQLD